MLFASEYILVEISLRALFEFHSRSRLLYLPNPASCQMYVLTETTTHTAAFQSVGPE